MRRTAPRSLAPALEQALAAARPATPLAAVQAVWRAAVGEGTAAVATPAALRDGTLTVACSSSLWAHELALLAPELLAGLNERLEGAPGAERVRALRFRAASEG